MQGQNSTPSSSLNSSHGADITQRVSATLSTMQWPSIYTPTTTPGTSSRQTPAPGGTSQTDSTRYVLSSPASGIASTPTLLRGLENLPMAIPNPEARTIITNPLWTWAAAGTSRQMQSQSQWQAVTTPQPMVPGSRCIHWFGHSDIVHLVFATGGLMELYKCHRGPLMSASDLEMVSYATWRIVQA